MSDACAAAGAWLRAAAWTWCIPPIGDCGAHR
jgi:hypothetical protein